MAEDRSTIAILRESRALAYSVGGLTLAAGVVLLVWPDRTVTVVARLVGLLLALVGAGDLLDTVRNHRRGSYWGLLALVGLSNLAFGLALLFWPGVTVSVVVWLVGLDLVLTGVLGLLVRGRMPEEYRAGMLSRSVLTIAFGVAVMAWPSATLNVVAFLVGALLVAFGLVLLWSGRQISRLADAVAA